MLQFVHLQTSGIWINQLDGGGKRRTADPIWSVDVHKIAYSIVTQGIRFYYLESPAPKRGFVKEELLIVPGDTVNSHMHMLKCHLMLYIFSCQAVIVLFC